MSKMASGEDRTVASGGFRVAARGREEPFDGDNARMSTTAGALLNIMSVRQAMHEAGTTHPHPSVAAATRQLVSKLTLLSADEAVEIRYETEPMRAWYVRCRTGEVLAELDTREGQ